MSESGLIDLFEQAYIHSIDNKTDVLTSLQDIQQKIEIDISEHRLVIEQQETNLK